MTRSSRFSDRSLAFVVVAALFAVTVAPALAYALAPSTTVRLQPSFAGPSGWYTVAPLVTLSSSQSGVLHWSWEVGAAQSASVFAFETRILAAPEGDHVLTAYSVNGSGESETPPVMWPLSVDSAAPSQPGSLNATVTLDVGVRLTWTASEDAISGVKNYAVYRKAGDPPFTSADIIDHTTGTAFADVPPAFSGSYTYAVSAWDVAGNESALSELALSARVSPAAAGPA